MKYVVAPLVLAVWLLVLLAGCGGDSTRTIGGVVNLAPTIRPVWDLQEKDGVHTGSAMLEIDFGNDEAPITNIPHWGDTKGDPHGRATELPGLGDAVLQFYETGQIQNPCGGEPCRVLN